MTDPIEAAARAICSTWDYEWDGDPETDEQVAPETDDGSLRPSKQIYREAARSAIAAYEAAMWRPINGETPKDGTIILLADGQEVAAAYWGFARRVDRMTADKTFPWVILDETNGTNAKRDPEAWRPLPPPPKE